MMITEEVISLQNWYIKALQRAGSCAITSGARDLYRREAIRAMDEFYETYGVELPHMSPEHWRIENGK